MKNKLKFKPKIGNLYLLLLEYSEKQRSWNHSFLSFFPIKCIRSSHVILRKFYDSSNPHIFFYTLQITNLLVILFDVEDYYSSFNSNNDYETCLSYSLLNSYYFEERGKEFCNITKLLSECGTCMLIERGKNLEMLIRELDNTKLEKNDEKMKNYHKFESRALTFIKASFLILKRLWIIE